jgi:hypothetical protein
VLAATVTLTAILVNDPGDNSSQRWPWYSGLELQ